MYFFYFVIISPWKGAGSFIWTNLNPLHPRMLCAKFGWNWPCGSGEEDFLISSMYFLITTLHLEKGRALHFNKLESSSPKNALCQVWLKLAQWFKILKFFQYILVIFNYLPVEKGGALHLNKLDYSSPKDALCKFGWNGRVVLEKKIFMTKTMTTTDNRQIFFIRKAHLNLLLRWAKNLTCYVYISLQHLNSK